jgi:hypothetical protein
VCFADGNEKSYLANFPVMYGPLMGGFAIFILVVALLIFICAILEVVLQMFKKSYVEGSQSSTSGNYVEMTDLQLSHPSAGASRQLTKRSNDFS